MSVSNEAMKSLMSYHWPGNVRQLKNVIESAVVLSDSEIIDAKTYLKSQALRKERCCRQEH